MMENNNEKKENAYQVFSGSKRNKMKLIYYKSHSINDAIGKNKVSETSKYKSF